MSIVFGSIEAQAIIKKDLQLQKLEDERKSKLPELKTQLGEAIDNLDEAAANLDHWQGIVNDIKKQIEDLES